MVLTSWAAAVHRAVSQHPLTAVPVIRPDLSRIHSTAPSSEPDNHGPVAKADLTVCQACHAEHPTVVREAIHNSMSESSAMVVKTAMVPIMPIRTPGPGPELDSTTRQGIFSRPAPSVTGQLWMALEGLPVAVPAAMLRLSISPGLHILPWSAACCRHAAC